VRQLRQQSRCPLSRQPHRPTARHPPWRQRWPPRCLASLRPSTTARGRERGATWLAIKPHTQSPPGTPSVRSQRLRTHPQQAVTIEPSARGWGVHGAPPHSHGPRQSPACQQRPLRCHGRPERANSRLGTAPPWPTCRLRRQRHVYRSVVADWAIFAFNRKLVTQAISNSESSFVAYKRRGYVDWCQPYASIICAARDHQFLHNGGASDTHGVAGRWGDRVRSGPRCGDHVSAGLWVRAARGAAGSRARERVVRGVGASVPHGRGGRRRSWGDSARQIRAANLHPAPHSLSLSHHPVPLPLPRTASRTAAAAAPRTGAAHATRTTNHPLPFPPPRTRSKPAGCCSAPCSWRCCACEWLLRV
jgi:hypothetical protein